MKDEGYSLSLVGNTTAARLRLLQLPRAAIRATDGFLKGRRPCMLLRSWHACALCGMGNPSVRSIPCPVDGAQTKPPAAWLGRAGGSSFKRRQPFPLWRHSQSKAKQSKAKQASSVQSTTLVGLLTHTRTLHTSQHTPQTHRASRAAQAPTTMADADPPPPDLRGAPPEYSRWCAETGCQGTIPAYSGAKRCNACTRARKLVNNRKLSAEWRLRQKVSESARVNGLTIA
jgi:hypothetical protein